MIISRTALEALRTGFRTDFKNGIAKAPVQYQAMTTVVSSSTKVETYGFLGDLPEFRKWVGEKRVRSLEEKSYSLINDDYEVTIGIHKNKIRDDNLGLYAPMVAGWGQEGGSLWDRLAFQALAAGHQRACYDGQNFFDDDHPSYQDGVPAWSNVSGANAVQPWYLLDLSRPLKPILLQKRQEPTFNMVVDEEDAHVFKTGEFLMGGEARGGAGYTFPQLAHRSTAALNAANYEAAKQQMRAVRNDEGEPLDIKPTHIVVGASNEAAAKNLFQKQTLANGESNIYFGEVTIIEARRLP